MRLAGQVAHLGKDRTVYMVLVGKPEGDRPLRKMKHRWDRIGSKQIIRRLAGRVESRFTWLKIGTSCRRL
jgi:hypothetical protein